ncbi:MAG TPA: glycosyltransferase family 4 protein [Candidatus Nanoarchaeia archaeon]|nr:glycosyltransferase family 4 protein [Candidatus Nanoarchaeia archaeon]
MDKKLKICHFFGGVRSMKLAKWQSQHGCEVHAISIEDPEIFKDYWKDNFQVHQNERATRLYNKLKPIQFLAVFKSYWFLYFFYMRTLAKVVKKYDIKIIHAHRHTGTFFAFLTKKLFSLKGVKIVFDYQDPWSAEELKERNIVQDIGLKLYFLLEGYITRNADLVVTQGQEQTDLLIKRYNVNPKRFIFTWNTSDITVFRPFKERDALRKKYGLTGKVAILYLGSIIDYFGIHLIPEAAKEVVKKYKNVKFVINGVVRDQKYWDDIKAKIKEYKLNDYFLEVQPKTKSEIPSQISMCDVGLVTHMKGSTICEVAIPTKLFEYMSSGLAVVCADMKHITQFVVPYKAGIAFEPSNASDLARALMDLLKNSKQIPLMGKNARKATEKKFNWDIEMKRVLDSYKSL